MKLVTTFLLLVLTGLASANGGLSLGTVENHMVKTELVTTPLIAIDHAQFAHGPIDRFITVDSKTEIADIDTSELNKDQVDKCI